MSANEPLTWVTTQVTPADKALLSELAKQDAQETGAVANQSATLRRLIRQEARRRGLNAISLLDQESLEAAA
jgi:hypothetical protein